MHKYGNVILKKGVFKTERLFGDWHNKIRMNTIEPQTVIIKLYDGEGNPTMTWTRSIQG